MRKIEYCISFGKMVSDEAWEKVKSAQAKYEIDKINFYEYLDTIKKEFDIDVASNGEIVNLYDDSEKYDNVLLEM